MAVYTVHQPPVKAGQPSADPDRFAFVRDGFHFWAFVLSPLWMIRRRLWLVLLLYVALTVAIEVALEVLGASDGVQFTVAVLISFLVGLEAGTLRRWRRPGGSWRQCRRRSAACRTASLMGWTFGISVLSVMHPRSS